MLPKFLRNLSIAICMGAIGLLSSGCLLRASTEEIPATAVAQNLPTLTPTGTETPVEPTPEPQVTTEFVVITATPDVLATMNAQATADAQAILDAQITAVAQIDPITDPLILDVTLTIAAATQAVFSLTQSAEAPLILATLPPTQEFLQPTATPAQLVQPVGSDCTHTVSMGENLFRIGLRYGVGYQTIANYNGIANPALISIGQQIQIPNCGQGTSDGFNTAASGTDPNAVGTTIGVGGVCGDIYIVEQYETLFGISMKCNVLIRDIMALNSDKISDPDRIYYRQELRLR